MHHAKPYDPTKHAYYPKVMKLYMDGVISSPKLYEVDIFHNITCVYWLGGYCNCDPIVKKRERKEGLQHEQKARTG